LIIALSISIGQVKAQDGGAEDPKIVRVIKNNGKAIMGELLSDDGREVLIKTEDLGNIYVPKHEIEKIEKVKSSDFREGEYVGDDRFATRYFLTTNGLPIKKGEHYGMLSFYGPEAHFAVSDNLNVGVMTTWLATPTVLSFKWSTELSEKVHLGIGSLAGVNPFFAQGYGGLLFGSLTLGDRKANVTVSGGYAGVASFDGSSGGSAPLLSLAGMFKATDKISLVADSFIYLGNSPENQASNFALVMPGMRYNHNDKFAIQLGVGAVVAENQVVPIPVPVGNMFFALN